MNECRSGKPQIFIISHIQLPCWPLHSWSTQTLYVIHSLPHSSLVCSLGSFFETVFRPTSSTECVGWRMKSRPRFLQLENDNKFWRHIHCTLPGSIQLYCDSSFMHSQEYVCCGLLGIQWTVWRPHDIRHHKLFRKVNGSLLPLPHYVQWGNAIVTGHSRSL